MLDVAPDMTVDKLKVLAVSHLHDPTESAKTSLYHKLVQVSTSKVLNEERSLTQESVRENGKKPEVKHKSVMIRSRSIAFCIGGSRISPRWGRQSQRWM